MIFLQLFLTFLEIGAFTFGGGLGMISVIRDRMLTLGWLTEEELLNMIAVSESTPGPLAVNMATFVGYAQGSTEGGVAGGVLGAFLATFGAVLPSFIIILLITALIKNFLKYRPVSAFLSGVRPCVVGLILATGVTMLLSRLLGFSAMGDAVKPDLIAIALFAAITLAAFLYKKIAKKKPSPILIILFSALLGMAVYSFV